MCAGDKSSPSPSYLPTDSVHCIDSVLIVAELEDTGRYVKKISCFNIESFNH